MSDEATNLIEQAEKLDGCRWDDPKNPNALYALFGAVAREMGRNPHAPRDDVAAGMLLANGGTPRNSMLAALLDAGMSPDDIAALFGK